MLEFFRKKSPRSLAALLVLLVFVSAVSTGMVWLAAAAQSDSTLFIPLVSNSDASESEPIVFDMAAESSSSQTWARVESVLNREGLAGARQPGKVTILLDGNTRENGVVEIRCIGNGCGEDTADRSQELSAQSLQDLEIVLFLNWGRTFVITGNDQAQVTIAIWRYDVLLDSITFICTSADCKIQVVVDGSGQMSTPTTMPVPTNTSTPMPTNTPVPTATPHEDMADLHWHAPGEHGDRPAHEHGDAAPQWVLDAGYDPTFTHVAGTPNENHAYFKHTGFKGYAGNFDGVDWYGIFHLDINPGGHASRFHSYQMWFRDGTDAVSHMHGWMDFGEGNNTGPNINSSCGGGTTDDARMSVIELGCPFGANFENWYSHSQGTNSQAPWTVDHGFNIATNYYFSSGADPANPATWTTIDGPGVVRNLTRRIEFAWYADRSPLRGDFWTTQFGDVVSGPNDAICGTQRSYGERSYEIVCLKQTIQPTLTTISFPGNNVQRDFPGAGIVKLPN